jgi:L-asparaginase type I
MSLPKVCLIYTGGTIGMVREDGVLKPPQNPDSFLTIAPELAELADIEFVPLLNKDSTNITPSDWTAMARAVYERMGPSYDYAGFVIAHGTDTMHFSASALAFAFGPNLNKPVVFTGAQTDASVRHGDARINLIRAVNVALEDLAEVVISFGDFIFRGCRTQKRDERRFDAFESPAFYPIGDITERILLHPAAHRRSQDPGPITFLPDFESNIYQVSLIPGLRPRKLRPLLDPGEWDGIVLHSFCAGNVPDFGEYSFEEFVREAVALDIPVIIASQFPANSTMDTAYEPGVKAIRSGAIPTGNMTNAAATAKFRWVLAQVRAQLEAATVQPDAKLDRVKYLMAKPYVDEMDVAGNARRTA